MNKLTLEHLAGYLPYDTGIMVYSKNQPVFQSKLNPAFYGDSTGIKLILRPLSDLTKEIEVGGEKFVPTKWIFGESLGNPNKGGQSIGHKKEWERKPETWKYYQLIHLFKWHFDIFGLIEKGLAIDINTL